MDLIVSPDLPAYVCYGIVLLLGMAVAFGEVRKRLGDVESFWLVPGTWLLFTAYVAVPLALFWLLDRTSAVSDTSVFAAFLIGFGYQGIVTGSNQSLGVPPQVSSWWTPFVAYADGVSTRAKHRAFRSQKRLTEDVIAEIVKAPSRYDALLALALDRNSDTAEVQKILTAIENDSVLSGDAKAVKKARALYGLVAAPDIAYLMRKKGVVGNGFYWMRLRQLRKAIPLAVGFVLVLVVLGYLGITSFNDRELRVTYHTWRLGKTNSSAVDQNRSRYQLVEIMNSEGKHRDRAAEQLIYLVQRPGLPMERVDMVVETLLETHPAAGKTYLSPKLVRALRVSSSDARARVHDALVFLAASCVSKPDSQLAAWKPTDKDSSTKLEERITEWNAYWANGCMKPSSPSSGG